VPRLDDRMLLGVFGLVFVGLGVAALLGIWKGWYWRSRGGAYAYIPLGVLFILFGWRSEVTEFFGTELALYGLFGALLGVGAWWSIQPPDFIKPEWVRWIEKHPEPVREAMRDEVERGEEWREHVASEDAVNRWARRIKPRQSGKGRR